MWVNMKFLSTIFLLTLVTSCTYLAQHPEDVKVLEDDLKSAVEIGIDASLAVSQEEPIV